MTVRNASGGPIGISERNPHYFAYHGKEILLITSAEHYGAVINKAFDYRRYFETLHEYGLNYTRIYPGTLVEEQGMFMEGNVLAPGEDLIVPWARSDTPGYIGGGNKFDLSEWDEEYFARLEDFLGCAQEKGIFVELCFFNGQSPRPWPFSPLHKDANIQGVGQCPPEDFQTLRDAPLVEEQLRYIEKLIVSTNHFDNVIYEFIDEPTIYKIESNPAYQWISKMIDKAVEVENKLPKKHLLAQQLEYGVNFADDDRISLVVTQYVEATCRQIGGMQALDNIYHLDKPIEDNETAFLPMWYQCDKAAASRLEAWEFMVGGGAGFNQLNGYFTVANPGGEDETNRRILSGLKNLRAFLEGMPFNEMTRDRRTVKNLSVGARVNGISKPGRYYAFYVHHSFFNVGDFYCTYYTPNFGEYRPVITIDIPEGAYALKWIEPETLRVLSEETITGGKIDIVSPKYTLDIAFTIVQKE